MLASTASGPSSFTGEFYLLPFSFEPEVGRHGDAETTLEAVGVSTILLSTLNYLGHGFVRDGDKVEVERIDESINTSSNLSSKVNQ